MIQVEAEPLMSSPTNDQKMVIPRRKLWKMLKILAFVGVLSVLGVVVMFLTTDRGVQLLNTVGRADLTMDGLKFSSLTKTLIFTDRQSGDEYLSVHFEYNLSSGDKNMLSCDSPSNNNIESKCSQLNLDFDNGLHAKVSETFVDNLKCYSVHWYTSNQTSDITNCFYMTDNWYGGGGLSIHRWPLNRANVPLQPHITQKYQSDVDTDEANFDSFIEPYFMSSVGGAVLLDHHLPLFISINHNSNQKICLTSAFKKPYTSLDTNEKLRLKYLVCKEKTAKLIHQHFLNTFKIQFWKKSPESTILQKPLWSTRGLDLVAIDETKVINLVKNIKFNHLPYSHLFIDGNYSQSPGHFYFNHKTFPRSQQLILELLNSPGEEKLPVGTEVYPHISSQQAPLFAVQYKNSTSMELGADMPHFLDVTNMEAVKHFQSHLTDLTEEISLRGFRFSGAYARDLLHGFDQSFLITNKTLENPNMFTTKIAQVASEFKATVLIGSGYNSQTYTFIADAGPMVSSWEHNKGLKSVIPMVLTFGLMGYPFGLMGPVGGVDIAIDSITKLFKTPNKELYVRWLQLMTYLPVMELSAGPWIYGQDVVNYTQTLLHFRNNDIWPKILLPAVEEASKFGTPIARPLWWVNPEDKTAQFIDCEFILGNGLLVAPVLYDSARHRDIYLPAGSSWKDQLQGQVYKGGQWLRRYNVRLFEIATFQQQQQ